ncbi:MAG: hypothetical protein ACFE9X_06165 [Promethearchaeota archaeon]
MATLSNEDKEWIENQFIDGKFDWDLFDKIKGRYLKIFSDKKWEEILKITDPPSFSQPGLEIMMDLSKLGIVTAKELLSQCLEDLSDSFEIFEVFADETGESWFNFILDCVEINVQNANEILSRELKDFNDQVQKVPFSDNAIYWLEILERLSEKGVGDAKKTYISSMKNYIKDRNTAEVENMMVRISLNFLTIFEYESIIKELQESAFPNMDEKISVIKKFVKLKNFSKSNKDRD